MENTEEDGEPVNWPGEDEEMFRERFGNFSRQSIHRLLSMFSWSRQGQQVPTHGERFSQVEAVMPQKELSTSTELILFKDVENPTRHDLSYTSLRDLLATHPRHCPIKPSEELKELEDERRPAIKNRLVELAARAYLLPTHVQTTPNSYQFFSRQWARLSNRNWLHSHPSTLTLQPNCLHWVDITAAFCSFFKLSQLRPQPVLRL